LLSLGVFGGLLVDAGRWRIAVWGGSALFVFSFFMLGICKSGQYTFIILSQGQVQYQSSFSFMEISNEMIVDIALVWALDSVLLIFR
jgi:hypothetical protein